MRREDWPRRLHERIRELTATPFAWGSNDCVCFAASITEAMTDVDPMVELRGTYATEREALRLLASRGGSIEAVMAAHGAEPVSVLKAQRGDYVEFDGALGICEGERAVFVTRDGVVRVPLGNCARAWRND